MIDTPAGRNGSNGDVEPAEMHPAVKDLVVQWAYLRMVPSQALEAVRAAARVPLSDDAAAAAVAHVEEIFGRIGRRARKHLDKLTAAYCDQLAVILDGYAEVQRAEVRRRVLTLRPVDGFDVCKPPSEVWPVLGLYVTPADRLKRNESRIRILEDMRKRCMKLAKASLLKPDLDPSDRAELEALFKRPRSARHSRKPSDEPRE